MYPDPSRTFQRLSEDDRIVTAMALRQAALMLTEATFAMTAGTRFAAPEAMAEDMREQGMRDDLSGIEIANLVSEAIVSAISASSKIATMAIFDGSMPDEEREEFFPGEFLVGEDGSIVYSLADGVEL